MNRKNTGLKLTIFLLVVVCIYLLYKVTDQSDMIQMLDEKLDRTNQRIEKLQVRVEELEETKQVMSIEHVFSGFKFINIDEDLARKIINGLKNITDKDNIFPKNEDFFLVFEGRIIGLFVMNTKYLERKVFIYNN